MAKVVPESMLIGVEELKEENEKLKQVIEELKEKLKILELNLYKEKMHAKFKSKCASDLAKKLYISDNE